MNYFKMNQYIWRTIVVYIICAGVVSAQDLPTQTSTMFSGSGNCAFCHSPGSSNALKDAQGKDVSPPTLWRSTMMANAVRDPFWQAKVTAEVKANPHLKSVIEDKCTTCHAPLGRTEAVRNGAPGYTLQEAQTDPLSRDGVSCTLCHQIKNVNLGSNETFSGHYPVENDRIIYGPYKNPVSRPMQMRSNYTPQFGEHVGTSELCATCHTLFTPYVDDNGDIVGQAPEQVPYLEWKNSEFPARDVQCQTCHMPDIDDPVVISNRPASLGARTPFANHYFVGGNVFMLRILRDNGAELGVTATAVHFDSTIARTLRMLQQESAELSAVALWDGDSLEIRVNVKNKTGHKFPTAYPSRRAWLSLEVRDGRQQTLFHSGAWDRNTGEIIGLDAPYERHHDLITREDMVQVYEPIMKDVNDRVNYTLLRAAGFLKDNRIPPRGFTTGHADYASTAIEGLAAQDANFNRNGTTQGTGMDLVTFRIGGLDKSQPQTIEIKLLYQTLAPRFVEDLFRYDTPEVKRFKQYYDRADKSPVTIDSLTLTVTATAVENTPGIPGSLALSAYPNPFHPATTIRYQLDRPGRIEIAVYSLQGKKVFAVEREVAKAGTHEFTWNGRLESGRAAPAGEYFVVMKFAGVHSRSVVTRTVKLLLMK